MIPDEWANPKIRNGTRRMLARRSELRETGDRAIGWKLAFGAPAWLEKFDLTGPLVGYLPESKRRSPGSSVSCEGWVRPVAEPEIAVHLESDVDDPEMAAGSVGGIGLAIELADVDPPPSDVEEVLAGNIFHRALIIGEPGTGLTLEEVGAMRAQIRIDGETVADPTDLEALTGALVEILPHAAALLGAAGEKFRAGDVLITGSVVPPIPLTPGAHVEFAMEPLSSVDVRV